MGRRRPAERELGGDDDGAEGNQSERHGDPAERAVASTLAVDREAAEPGPMVMPTLNDEKLTAVASVGASSARLNTRAFSAGLVANPKPPSRKIAPMAITGTDAQIASTAESATTPVIPTDNVRNGVASAFRPPMVIPISEPTPYRARTAGTAPDGRPVVSVSRGAK